MNPFQTQHSETQQPLTKLVRGELIRIKILDPHCRFRVETNASAVLEQVMTEQTHSQGLEAPETAFVEESAFREHFGRAPEEHELVTEEYHGQKMRGVT